MHISYFFSVLKKLPRWYYLFGGLILIVVLIAALFWPRTISLSYASAKTCFYQPTVAPQLLRSSGDGYRIEADQVVRIGNIAIAAATMCLVPLKAPQQGAAEAQLSFLGTFLRKTYHIDAPQAPRLVSGIPKAPIPISKSMKLKLSDRDALHTYKMLVDGARAPCTTELMVLSCDIQKLGLRQGKDYTVVIERYFASKRINEMVNQSIHTLEATSIVSSSIKQGEIVFAKPTEFDMVADKEIAEAKLRLYKVDGTKREEVKSQTSFTGTKISLRWDGELARMSTYELDVVALTGSDGSGLDGSYKLGFALSGGPKVTNVSVGTYKAPIGGTIAITFDQPINETQDLSKAVTVTGGASLVSAKGNQILISLRQVPRCGEVSIKVSDALKSSYDISGGSGWQHATRTLCQTQESIGTSVKGRAIMAYRFGNGGNTIVYTGAIHGSESSTRALMLRWVDELEANPRSIPANKTIVVIPVLNPDGIASGSRTNANNVDLNRNFATGDWASDITTTSNTPFPGGGGKTALSEPESRAVANFVGRTRPSLVLSYHSIGGLLAANQAGDSNARAATYASLSGYRNTTGSSDTFEYGISGTADDYYREAYGVPSLLIELGSHTDAQFSRNQKAMWAMLR